MDQGFVLFAKGVGVGGFWSFAGGTLGRFELPEEHTFWKDV